MNTPRCRTLVTGLACLILATGCMLGGQTRSLNIIAPEVELTTSDEWPEVDWSLQIRRPVADQMRDSARILVRVGPSRMQPYPSAVWLDSVPEMLQSAMIQAHEDSGRIAGVSRPGSSRSRYSLTSELRRFEAVDTGGPDLEVEIVLQANLVHVRSSRMLATRRFEHRATTRGKELDELIEAFEQALGELATELVGWTLESGQEAENREREDWQRGEGRRRGGDRARSGQ